MSKEYLLKMLKTLCEYNNVLIEHKIGNNNKPQIIVKCVKYTQTIAITYLDSQTTKLFDNFEEAAEVILQIINTDKTS